MKKLTIASLVAVFALFGVGIATVHAAPVEKTDAFVCPVLSDIVGANNPNAFGIADGDYSLIPAGEPPHIISVPMKATNDNGAGSPGGQHAAPGDTDYTAIWAN